VNRYVCEVCGYTYDPIDGDPGSGISPGTSFDQLPEDWVCPVCGLSKDAFRREDL
jgi:rubredoxin